MKLNVACGDRCWDGFENSDIQPFSDSPNVRHVDLDRPLPYPNGVADMILISHGLCLRPRRARILGEFHRVLRPGGWLRIDDNPWRFHVEGENPPLVEIERGFPAFRRLTRASLKRMLGCMGYRDVTEHEPQETLIPCDAVTRLAIVGNSSGHHHTFTVEARK